ncbi:MAG: exonuclease SbcCD subunit D [Bacteroidales bacterium]
MKQLKFVHTADLHLDTPFKGLSAWNPDLAGKLKDATYRSFSNIVDLCISERVDFLLIAGDIFDSENMSLAAQIRFIDELKRLSASNIPAYFICGNHDNLASWDTSLTLPPGVHRFGSSGVEKMTYLHDNDTVADIYGISYQDSYIFEDLVPFYRRTGKSAPFSIAMLHGMADVVGRDEKYAPFSLKDLIDQPFDYWALGHVHKGRVLHDHPPVVYPGNPQGRDFGETGEKGCYLVEMAAGAKPRLKFIPVQHVRFEELSIDLTGHDDISELVALIDRAREKLMSGGRNQGFVLRLLLTGRTGMHKILNRPGEADQLAEELNTGQPDQECFSFVDSLRIMTRPATDPAQITQGSDFAGELIKNIERYENDSELLDTLTGQLINELPVARIFREVDELSETDKRGILERAKWILTDRLADYAAGDDAL